MRRDLLVPFKGKREVKQDVDRGIGSIPLPGRLSQSDCLGPDRWSR